MQFNSEANSLDIVSDTKFWCNIDSSDTTSYPLTAMARNANFALDKIQGWIFKADGRWQYDDFNNAASELLSVATSLVSGTKKYAIPVTWLKIGGVRAKDSAGNWKTLKHIDRRKLSDAKLVETGDPTSYDLLGNWIYLTPTPNYASSGGLEVQFQPGPSYFASTDTTKTPGFATTYHRLVPLLMSQDYLAVNNMPKRLVEVREMINQMREALIEHYADRHNAEQDTISFERDDYGEVSLGHEGRYDSNPDGF